MEENEITFEPFPKQLEFLEAAFGKEKDIVLYGGSIRGGKTYAGIGTLLMFCKIFPLSRWAIVRVDLPTLKRNTIPSFQKIVPKHFIKSYNQDTQTVTFHNGSEIIFFAENYTQDKELNRWKGLEVNGFLLEEVNELQEVSFYKAIERAGSNILNPTPPQKILATCNPSQNWVKELFYNRWKTNNLPDKWEYIPAKIFDNPYIPKEYLESLKEMPSYEYEVFVNGDWDIQPRTGYEFYKSFNTKKHINKTKYDRELPLHISLDFNVVPYISMGVWQIKGNDLVKLKEYSLSTPNNNTLSLGKAFKRDYSSHYSGVYYYGDPSGKSRDTRTVQGTNDFTILHEEIKNFMPKDRVLKKAPSVSARGNFLNAVFEGLTDWNITIDKDCKESIKDYINLKEAMDGTKKKNKIKVNGMTYEEYGHHSDSDDYFLCKILEEDFRKFIGKRKRILS